MSDEPVVAYAGGGGTATLEYDPGQHYGERELARAEELRDQAAGAGSADESRRAPRAKLKANYRYLFRSYPGSSRQMLVHIPTLPDRYLNERHERSVKAKYLKKYGLEKARLLHALRDRVGSADIFFQNVPGHAECFYGTDDPVIARYLREAVREGKGVFPDVYEERPNGKIYVNGVSFDDNAEGWQAAGQFARETGVATITRVDPDLDTMVEDSEVAIRQAEVDAALLDQALMDIGEVMDDATLAEMFPQDGDLAPEDLGL